MDSFLELVLTLHRDKGASNAGVLLLAMCELGPGLVACKDYAGHVLVYFDCTQWRLKPEALYMESETEGGEGYGKLDLRSSWRPALLLAMSAGILDPMGSHGFHQEPVPKRIPD